MKFYSKNSLIISILLILSVGFGMVYWLSLAQEQVLSSMEVSSEPEPIAQVETIKLHKGKIQETLNAYGVVLPLPDKLTTLSVPYISKVDKVQVNQGQIVQQGDVLLSLKPGAKAKLQLEQAVSELNAANSENKLLRERIQLKLATKQNLVASRLRVERAKVMLKNLSEQGIANQQYIKAEHNGIIYLMSVQQGQIVAAGAPLLQIVDQNQWMVRLGIEPEDYDHLQINQQVLITPVNTPVSEPIKGRIEIITHQINTATRLLNVFVRPELNQTLLINDFVKGQVIISTSNVFLVPRQAVLPDDGSYSLFTVENGLAIKHSVQIGIDNESQVEVIALDLKALDDVVVLGNHELESGMQVSAMPSTAPLNPAFDFQNITH